MKYPIPYDVVNRRESTTSVSGESHRIGEDDSGYVYLDEVPNTGTSVTVTGTPAGGGSFSEISSGTPAAGEFKVIYSGRLGGALEFNAADDGVDITVDYTATGSPVWAAYFNRLKTWLNFAAPGRFNVLDYDPEIDEGADDTDCTTEIQAAADAATAAAQNSFNRVTLYFPELDGDQYYRITDTITVGANVSVHMKGRVKYDGVQDRAAFDIGPTDNSDNERQDFLMRVTGTDNNWSDENYVGIIFRNPRNCRIDIRQTRWFTLGTLLYADNGAVAYNTIWLGSLQNHKVGLDIYTEGANGFANQNTVVGGQFGMQGTPNTGTDRYGVRQRTDVNAGTINSWNWLNPNFELKHESGSHLAIPWWIEHGQGNVMWGARHEANGTDFMHAEGSSSVRNIAYLTNVNDGDATVDDDTSQQTNWVMEVGYGGLHLHKVYQSPPLALNQCNFNGDNNNAGRGFHYREVNASPTLRLWDENVMWGGDEAQPCLRVKGQEAPAIYLGTYNAKHFLVYKDVEPGQLGRIAIRAWDEDNVELSGASTDYIIGPSWNGTVNMWREDSDSKYLNFSVHPDVVKVEIIFDHGTNDCHIRSFAIFAAASYRPPSVHVWSDAPNEFMANGAEPTKGIYNLNERVINKDTTAGQEIWWICTTAGGAAQGTWSGGGSYVEDDWLEGSDGNIYRAVQAGGQAQDPTTDTGETYWVRMASERAVFASGPTY